MQLQLRPLISNARTNISKYKWQLAVGGVLLAFLFWKREDIIMSVSGVTDKALWCKKVYAAVDATLPSIPEISKLIIVAHAAFESGYGKAKAAQAGNNLFNITAGPAWTGQKWVDVGGDTDGHGNSITQTWRMYPSVNAGIADYWSFLGPNQNGGRYAAAQDALIAGDLSGFVYSLHDAGYFTLDPSQYLASMSAVVNTVQNFVS